MDKKWLVIAGLLLVIGIMLPRAISTRTVVVPGPPTKPDTIFVQDTVLKLDTLFRRETVFSTDTVNLVETVLIADTVYIPFGTFLPPRAYVTEVTVGESLGDTTWLAGTKFSSDSAGMRFNSFAMSYWTAGPLAGFRAEGDSIRVAFREFPRVKECSFFDKLGTFIMGTGTGIVIGKVF